ncbi:hypothetical protein COCNU_scaffold021696G000010 [Cocos nucifera]|nr:hypothetical protein [Cocos nucifera]
MPRRGGGGGGGVRRESLLTRAVGAVFAFVRLAEFEILFLLFFFIAFLIFKDLPDKQRIGMPLYKYICLADNVMQLGHVFTSTAMTGFSVSWTVLMELGERETVLNFQSRWISMNPVMNTKKRNISLQ